MPEEPPIRGDDDFTNPGPPGLSEVLRDRLLKLNRDGDRCNRDLIDGTNVVLAMALLKDFTVTPRGPDLDVAEDVFGSPNLSLLDLRLRERLAQLTATSPQFCPAEDVEFIAWMLAEAVLETFRVEASGWVS